MEKQILRRISSDHRHLNRMEESDLDAVTPFVLYHGWISEVIHPVRGGPVLEGRLERPYRFQPRTPHVPASRLCTLSNFRRIASIGQFFVEKPSFPSPLDLIIRLSFKKIESKLQMLQKKKCRWIDWKFTRRVMLSFLLSHPLPLRIPLLTCSDASIIDYSNLK